MPDNSPYDPDEGDWQTLESFFSPTEAYLLQGCLQASGIPAMVTDDQTVQTHTLLASAIQVRVLVPERRLAQAEAVRQAWRRGDFALPDDDTQYLDPR
ncbi:putative signal transducing protein [Tepidicella xavieri]|jgi:hypothetical protein|uniref:Putative signal transducing protein n=1 Tax=Tepidicella xavieri TaxID=360241 RepID=A0A4R6U7L4_9BURK|nr:DUF2007 domain-containing protein [Tepidicella xavieri]TDQ42518.1 putative signal transducing protein [Tepidicella xavieri]